MAKDQKKQANNNNESMDNFSKEKNSITKNVEEKIKDTLTKLNNEDKKKLKEIFGEGDFLEQLRKYFEKEHPSLLDEIENKDKLKIYVEQLQNSGFTINTLITNTKILHESFKESESEYKVTEKTLKKLQDYCIKEEGRIPAGLFDNFARFINIKSTPISIEKNSTIQKASDLIIERNKFLEHEKKDLDPTQKEEMDKIMKPNYAPTSRLLVSAAIKKIKKTLPKELQEKFKTRFTLPINISSDMQDLHDFKQQRQLFLQENKNDINQDLAKKLDNVKVLNQDMFEEFENEGIVYNRGKGFSEQEQEFKIIFNKLATRQLFDDVNKKNTIAEIQIENIGEIFNNFPPYINDIFKNPKYRYNESEITNIDTPFKNDIDEIDNQIDILNKESRILTKESERAVIMNKIKELRKTRNKRKREGYAKWLASKNPKLGPILTSLIQNNFNLSKIDKPSQQILLDDLVEDKLKGILANNTAASLGIDEQRFSELVKDLFDLNKKTITIPTPNGDISFECPEKTFFGGPLTKSMEIGIQGPGIAEEDKQNLPLNIKLLLSEDNKDFFEKSPIFGDLFQDIDSKKGPIKLNDSYKVRIRSKDTESYIDGYLSKYPPKGEKGNELIQDHKRQNPGIEPERYLYSQPITRPEDDRELLFWDKNNENAVIIGDKEAKGYDIEIIERELNINKKGIGALLFATTVGQHAQENQISNEQTKKLEEKFKKLDPKNDTDIYIDTIENKEKIPEENIIDESKEKQDSTFKKTIEAWKKLDGYQTVEAKPDAEGESRYGFEEGAKMIIPYFEPSLLPPEGEGTAGFLTLEISKIDKKNNTFTFKMSGGETKLGGNEGKEITLPLTPDGLKKIGDVFEKKIYKLPKNIDEDQNNMISILEQADIEKINPSKFFGDLERKNKSWIKNFGEKTEDVMYFGRSEFSPGEQMDEDPVLETLCKVEYNASKERPYTVYIHDKKGKDSKGNEIDSIKVKTEMDKVNFALFIASKKLSPRTKNEVEKEKKEKDAGAEEAQTGNKIPISIGSIIGLFKTASKKIEDAMKKYQEAQENDFTESIMFEGNLMNKLASIMPSEKLKSAFGKVGEEYMLQRDSKVWTKIEDRVKIYTADPDFGSPKMRNDKIKPYLDGDKPFKNHWQAAAMLLATIEKGKGPYSRNTDRAGKGMWIKILMGKEHQNRYLKMKEKLEKELADGIALNGQGWANDRQNEILKLEMKYITHVVDGRQLRRSDEDVALQEGKFSKAFAGDLEKKSNEFFKDTATSAYAKTKDISFELARFEYFRLLGDRPQQAIANLKAVAEKAVTESQFKIFESMVLTGILSGVFNSITQEDKKMIEEVCRAEGFLPGLLIRQPNAHHKITKLLNIATGNNFSKEMTYGKGKKHYNPNDFNFGKLSNTGQAKDFVHYDTGFNGWYTKNSKYIKEFFSFSGGNTDKKKLIDVYEDTETPNDTKQLLKEIIDKRYETNEELDQDIRANGKALQQNILCRNDSLINEIIKFGNGSFNGKNKDAITDAQDTRKKISRDVPSKKLENKNDVIFTLKMFTNRFSKNGFNSTQQKFLIKLLKAVQEEKKKDKKESADKMLWYGIVGQIVQNAGSGQVPDELITGLELFKKFFENNLDTILTEKVISEGFGNDYVSELEKKTLKVAPWSEYVKVTDYKKGNYSIELSKEQNQEISKKKAKYAIDTVYINKTIYDTASLLEKRGYGIPNSLKEMYDREKDQESTSQQLEETLNGSAISLKNHIAVEKALRKKDIPDDGLTDEERARRDDNDEEGGYSGGYEY